VFGGGGGYSSPKPPGNDFEVYNDFNGLLVNLSAACGISGELKEHFNMSQPRDFELVRDSLPATVPLPMCRRRRVFIIDPIQLASSLDSSEASPTICGQNIP
jgi:DNA adenine methylase